MKFYMREPEKALEGMGELTLEQVGAYTIIIDHLYARDGLVPNNDALLARWLNIHAQRWRRLKAELIAAGKIRITRDNLIDANGVETCRKLASLRSVSARKAASLRWDNYRKVKEIKETPMLTAMLGRNASISTSIKENSSNNSDSEIRPPTSQPPAASVARNGSSGGGGPQLSTTEIPVTAALEKSLRQKGWI